MVEEIIEYLDSEDISQLSDGIKNKLANISKIYNNSFIKCTSNAEKAYHSVVSQLQDDVAQATQRAIELEMELVKCRTDLAALKVRSSLRQAGKGSRKELVIVKAKLRSIRKFLTVPEESLDSIRNEEMRKNLNEIEEENLQHKEKEKIYQTDIFNKASEILQLKGKNEDLKLQLNIMEQHRMNYLELHESYVKSELEQAKLYRRIEQSNGMRESSEGTKSLEERLRGMQEMLMAIAERNKEWSVGKKSDGLSIVGSSHSFNTKKDVLVVIKQLKAKVCSLQSDFAILNKERSRVFAYLLNNTRNRQFEVPNGKEPLCDNLRNGSSAIHMEFSDIKRQPGLLSKDIARSGAYGGEPTKRREYSDNAELFSNSISKLRSASTSNPDLSSTTVEDLHRNIEMKELYLNRQTVLLRKYRKLKDFTARIINYIQATETIGR